MVSCAGERPLLPIQAPAKKESRWQANRRVRDELKYIVLRFEKLDGLRVVNDFVSLLGAGTHLVW